MRPTHSRAALIAAAAITATLAIIALIVGLAPAAAHADDPAIRITSVTTHSVSDQQWSRISIQATWEADDPHAGDSFTITLDPRIGFPSSLRSSWDITHPDDGEIIGRCDWPGGDTVTCVLNHFAEDYDYLRGGTVTLQAVRTQITTSDQPPLTIVVGGRAHIVGDDDGDGRCDTHCITVEPDADKSTYKAGWHEGDRDGLHVYDWDVVMTGQPR